MFLSIGCARWFGTGELMMKLNPLILRAVTFLPLVVALIGVAFFAWRGANAASDGVLLKPDDQALVTLGSQIYLDNCASCHGENLLGQPNWKSPGEDGLLPAPPHDESGHTWHHTDKLLFELTKFGFAKISGLANQKSNMPIYQDILSDKEIIAALSYIKSSWPQQIRQRHDQLNQQVAGQN